MYLRVPLDPDQSCEFFMKTFAAQVVLWKVRPCK